MISQMLAVFPTDLVAIYGGSGTGVGECRGVVTVGGVGHWGLCRVNMNS